MATLFQFLAWVAASMCVGGALAIGALFAFMTRDSDESSSEGCLGRLLTFLILILGLLFGIVALLI